MLGYNTNILYIFSYNVWVIADDNIVFNDTAYKYRTFWLDS